MLEQLRRKYIGDRNFYKSYIALALPMILQNAVTNLVSFLDNIMVGQLGTEQMSGVAIVNQLIFVYNLAIFGAVSAASIFGAQYFGKGNHKGHMYSFRFKLYAALTVTALTILLFVTKGENLISLYLTDTSGSGATGAALQYGLEYLIIMMAGLIPFAVNQAYATNIKETGQTLIPMIASFVAVGSNAILDYLLIFGIGPFPELGVQGAALATVIARYIEALMFTGCAQTPDSSLVKPKGSKAVDAYTEADDVSGSKGEASESKNDDGSESKTTIRNLIDAPQNYKSHVEDDSAKLVVNTDASVEIPEVEKISAISVTAAEVTQELLDRITNAFFSEAKLYTMDSYYVKTKDEIKKTLDELKEDVANGNLDPYNYGTDDDGNYVYDIYEDIETWEQEYETAPEKKTLTEAKPVAGNYFSCIAQMPDDSQYYYMISSDGSDTL